MNKYFLGFVFFVNLVTYAQYDSTALINDKLIELIEDISENTEESQILELIEELKDNPIDLNSATKKDFLKIPFLSPNDVDEIIKTRNKRKLTSINDLYQSKNINPDIIKLIKPFIIIKKDNTSKMYKTNIELRSRYQADIQSRKGFRNNFYKGNKLKNYNRIKINSSYYKFGLLTEKDAGEKNYSDHYSGFLQLNFNWILNKIIIGDFNYEFGQGLIMWSPYSFSKGSDAINSPLKRERNIIPHNSSEENNYFRGIATNIKLGNFQITPYYSQNKIDATKNDANEITNFYSTGYHRTETEISKKDNLQATSYGMSLSYNYKDFFDIGILHFRNNYSHSFPFQSKNTLKGNSFNFTSAKFNLHLNNYSLFGEIAYNNQSLATVNGLYFSLNKNIKLVTIYRNYSASFYNIYSNGFGESNNTQNETGFYFGVKLNTSIGIFNLYYDIFNSPAKSYYSDFPNSGNDFMTNYSAKINKNLKVLFKFKHETKEILASDSKEYHFKNETKTNYRIEFKYNIGEKVYGKTRVELVKYHLNPKSETGIISFQDIKYKLSSLLTISSRIIFFETDSYNSRIYEFENDLKGIMINLPMFGKGLRYYFLINFNLNKNFRLYLKYSELYKPNLTSLGSGNSKILGNIDNRLSFQLDLYL